MTTSNPIMRFLRGTARWLDRLRRAMHFLLLLVLFAVLLAVLPGGPAPLPKKAALVIDPEGPLVDQLAGDPVSRALDELSGRDEPQTLVRDLVEAIDKAGGDKRIGAIFLRLDRLGGAGLPKLERVAEAIERFRATGKPVVAYGDYYLQNAWFVAAHADEVYLHPSGFVFLQGYGRFRTYYAEAIDKLSIDWNVFRVGEFKSFVEPYIRDDMSQQDKAASRVWLEQLWAHYLARAAMARGRDADDFVAVAAEFDTRLARNGGDTAAVALDAGLVDALKHRDQVRDRMIELVGKNGDRGFASVGFAAYLEHVRPRIAPTGNGVGVIVAAGEILDGRHPPGRVGGDTLSELIRRARTDDSIKAVVLQVDSPGGSKFASEVILRELRELKRAGKPLVVSMSSVAASGGYWIAMDADEIFARPATITGSIGIGAFFPTVQRTLDRIGVHTDGIGTTQWAGEFRPDRELGEPAQRVLQLGIEHGYRQFIAEVAKTRDMDETVVDRLARGRVYSGADAHRLGLVDSLGGIAEAIAAAADRAGLSGDFPVRYIEKELSFRESVSLMFARQSVRLAAPFARTRGPANGIVAWLDRLQRDLDTLAVLNDPGNLYALCFCAVE